jgi:hypothetical protein
MNTTLELMINIDGTLYTVAHAKELAAALTAAIQAHEQAMENMNPGPVKEPDEDLDG